MSACEYCLAAISFEAPHKGDCDVQKSIDEGKYKTYLLSTDLTDEDFAARSDNDLITDFVRYSNHASHLRFAQQRWSQDAKRVFMYLRQERGINADEVIRI